MKIDVIVPAESAFETSRRRRGRLLPVGDGLNVRFASHNDVIIRKLEYFREGGSEKYLRDIAGVLKIQGDKIDRRYLVEWAERQGMSELWDLVLRRADHAEDPGARTNPGSGSL